MPPEAAPIPVLEIDIAGFTSRYKNSDEQQAILTSLRKLIDLAAKFLLPHGPFPEKFKHHSTGDGYYILLAGPPVLPALEFTRRLMQELEEYNQKFGQSLPLQLRLVLADAERLMSDAGFKEFQNRSAGNSALFITNLFHIRMLDALESDGDFPELHGLIWTLREVEDKHGQKHFGYVLGDVSEWPEVSSAGLRAGNDKKHNLPHRGSRTFVGRGAELDKLRELLQGGEPIAIAALHGMGGVGKTELALQFAWRHQGDYPLGVCWLDGQAGEPVIEFIRYAAAYWDVSAPEGLESDEQFDYILRHLPQGTALIVLDDFPGEFPGFLRGLPQGYRLLLTTREDPGQGFQTISLAVLSPGAALDLLGALIGGENQIAVQQGEAETLCEWLGYLPLALELVGNYLRARPDLSLARMRERLDEKGIKHASLEPDKWSGIRTSRHKSVWAALELSREVLSDRGLELAFLLSQLGQARIHCV